MQLRIIHKGMVLVLVPAVIELGFATQMLSLERRLEAQIRQETRSKAIVLHANELFIAAVKLAWIRAEESMPGLLIKPAPRAGIETERYIDKEYDTLLSLVDPNSPQFENLGKIKYHIDSLQSLASQLFETGNDLYGSMTMGAKIRAVQVDLAKRLRQFKDPEIAVSAEITAQVARTRHQMLVTSVAAIFTTIALAAGLLIFFIRGITNRIDQMVENTERLAARRPLLTEIGGGDELEILDKSFHNAALKLDELEQLKKDFYHMVTHDLRSPLSSVTALLDLMQLGAFGQMSPKADDKLTIMRRNTERMLTLINDLLDMEKLAAGKMQLQLNQVKVSKIFEEALQTIEPVADSKKIKVVTRCEDSDYCHCEQTRIVQVLINLTINAVKFAPDESTITLAARHDENAWEFSISDQGRGIPKSALEKLFQPFEQVSLEDGKRGTGTGLGLSICKMIVEAHNGKIWAESSEAVGSTFFFTIPDSATPGEKAPLTDVT